MVRREVSTMKVVQVFCDVCDERSSCHCSTCDRDLCGAHRQCYPGGVTCPDCASIKGIDYATKLTALLDAYDEDVSALDDEYAKEQSEIIARWKSALAVRKDNANTKQEWS